MEMGMAKEMVKGKANTNIVGDSLKSQAVCLAFFDVSMNDVLCRHVISIYINLMICLAVASLLFCVCFR